MKTPQEILDLYYLPPDMYGNFKIMQAMEDYADQFKPKWIPVTERLPEKSEDPYMSVEVWVYDSVLGHIRARYSFSLGEWIGMAGAPYPDFVTHWMPLPEKPS